MYTFVLEIEMILFMRYKINPFSMEQYMSIQDLHGFYKTLSFRVEEENQQANRNGGNKLIKSLIAIRDILNFMFAKENPR